MGYQKKIFFTIALAVVFYLAATLWIGWNRILEAMVHFRWWILPVCLLLAFANYLVRFTKWHYYLTLLEIPLKRRTSFQVFLAGLVMSATPGKFGEVFKSYLIKSIVGTPMSKTAPVVLAERFTDFLALLLMSLLGVTLLPNGLSVFAVCLGIILVILIAASWKSAAETIFQWMENRPWIGGHVDKFRIAYESIYVLIAPKPLVWATAISVVSWFCECLAFYLVLWGFDAALPIIPATFIYAFATIMGALLMTPGGIGPTEGTMDGLLILLHSVPKGIAASATLIIRLCTLWFAVAVGLAVLTLCAGTFASVPTEIDLQEEILE